MADASGDQILRAGVDGAVTAYPVAEGAFPTSIVAGPDGALWFTEARGDAIGRITPEGAITEHPLPTAGAFAGDIIIGADGAFWFIQGSRGVVGRLDVGFPAPIAAVGTTFEARADEKVRATVATFTDEGADARVPSTAIVRS